jgi:hypothetical protein
MKKINFNMINYQAAYVLIWTNSNHTTFRPLHSRETVHFKPYIGSALFMYSPWWSSLVLLRSYERGIISRRDSAPRLAHTHKHSLSRRCVVSCCCTCPPCATSRLRLKELAKSFVRRRALDDAPACLTITSKRVWWQKWRQTVRPIWRGLPWTIIIKTGPKCGPTEN